MLMKSVNLRELLSIVITWRLPLIRPCIRRRVGRSTALHLDTHVTREMNNVADITQ